MQALVAFRNQCTAWLVAVKPKLIKLVNRRAADQAVAELSVLFICTGNICRSPTAQGIFEHKLAQAGLDRKVFVDSAGTHGFHVGNKPDARARRAAARRGFDLSRQRSRRIETHDFVRFDYVVGMDHANMAALHERCPAAHRDKLSLLLQFMPAAELEEVPDPYYGGSEGFERVLDLLDGAADALLEDVRRRL